MSEKIYILGHQNPDADSIMSAMLMRDILASKGVDCECAILETDILSKDIVEIANSFGSYSPVVIKTEDIEKHKYFLVDHNDISATIKNKDLIVGIIDHHKNKEWDIDDVNFIFSNRCSTTLAIYQKFKKDYTFTNHQKELILIGLAFDSRFGRSKNYMFLDGLLADDLRLGKMPEDLFKLYFKPSDLSPDKILCNGRKQITIDNKIYESCSVECDITQGFNALVKAMQEDESENFIGLISDIEKCKTTVVIKENGEIAHLKNFDRLYSRKELERDFPNFNEPFKNIEYTER